VKVINIHIMDKECSHAELKRDME